MNTSSLNSDTVQRLTQQFESFDRDRKSLHSLLDEYILDYRSLSGTALEKQELLREKYRPKVPALSHLFYEADGTIYWRLSDIAIVMGREDSSISRTLHKIERTRGWRSRLYELRKTLNNNLSQVYAYGQGIFDLIIDFYEEEYLHRFIKPRRGKPLNAQEKQELHRFWAYLKMQSQANIREGYCLRQPESADLAEIPPLTLLEIVRLIVKKIFTIKTGAFFTVLLAFAYGVSRKWDGLYLWLPVFCGLLFAGVVFAVRYRKGDPNLLSNAGAGILLFMLLWSGTLLSEEGREQKTENTPRLSSAEYADMVKDRIPGWGRIFSGAEAFAAQLKSEVKEKITDEEFDARIAQLQDSIPALLQQRDTLPFSAIQSAVRDVYLQIAEMCVTRFQATGDARLLDQALSAYKSAEHVTFDPTEKSKVQEKIRDVLRQLDVPIINQHAALMMEGAAFLERFRSSGNTMPDENELEAVQNALRDGISEMLHLSVTKSARPRLEVQILKGDIYIAAYEIHQDMDMLSDALGCYEEAGRVFDLDLADQELKTQAWEKSANLRSRIDKILTDELQKGIQFLERLHMEKASTEEADIIQAVDMLDTLSRRACRYSSQESLHIVVKAEILRGDIYAAFYDINRDMTMLENALLCYEEAGNTEKKDEIGEGLKNQAEKKAENIRTRLENAPREVLREGTVFLGRLRADQESAADENIGHIRKVLEKAENRASDRAHMQNVVAEINILMGDICMEAYTKTHDVLMLNDALRYYKRVDRDQLSSPELSAQVLQKTDDARMRLENLVEETTRSWVDATESMLRSAREDGKFSVEAMQKLAADMDAIAEFLIHYQNASFNASFAKCYQAQAILYYNIGQLYEWQYRHCGATEALHDAMNSYYRTALFYAQTDKLKQSINQALETIKQ